jgi:hypothetical protein
LGQTFFGPTSENKPILEEEIYYCVKHIGFSRSDILNMPTFVRKYHISFFLKELEQQKEK